MALYHRYNRHSSCYLQHTEIHDHLLSDTPLCEYAERKSDWLFVHRLLPLMAILIDASQLTIH